MCAPWNQTEVLAGQLGRGDLGLRRPHTSQPVKGAGSAKVLKYLSVPAVPVGPGVFRKLPEPGKRPQGVSVLLSSLIFFRKLGQLGQWGLRRYFNRVDRPIMARLVGSGGFAEVPPQAPTRVVGQRKRRMPVCMPTGTANSSVVPATRRATALW